MEASCSGQEKKPGICETQGPAPLAEAILPLFKGSGYYPEK
jgi:hypothetical protein